MVVSLARQRIKKEEQVEEEMLCLFWDMLGLGICRVLCPTAASIQTGSTHTHAGMIKPEATELTQRQSTLRPPGHGVCFV